MNLNEKCLLNYLQNPYEINLINDALAVIVESLKDSSSSNNGFLSSIIVK